MLIRKFIYLVVMLSLSLIVTAEVIEIDFVYVGDVKHSSLLGIKQGIDESNLQGQFLNQKYNLDIVASNEIDGYDFSKYIAVLTSLNASQLKKLAKQLTDTPVFNLVDESNELRLNCISNILHIAPSSKMKSDALEQ